MPATVIAERIGWELFDDHLKDHLDGDNDGIASE